MSTEQKLVELKDRIEKAKTKASEIEGANKQLKQQLLDTFQCKTIEEAKILLEEFENKINDIDSKLNQGLKKIEEQEQYA